MLTNLGQRNANSLSFKVRLLHPSFPIHNTGTLICIDRHFNPNKQNRLHSNLIRFVKRHLVHFWLLTICSNMIFSIHLQWMCNNNNGLYCITWFDIQQKLLTTVFPYVNSSLNGSQLVADQTPLEIHQSTNESAPKHICFHWNWQQSWKQQCMTLCQRLTASIDPNEPSKSLLEKSNRCQGYVKSFRCWCL